MSEIVRKISELYSRYPEARKRFKVVHPYRDLVDWLQKAEEKSQQELPWKVDTEIQNYAIFSLLSFLPAEVVIENFGEEAAILAWTESSYERSKTFLQEIHLSTEKDTGLLEKARLAQWRRLLSREPKTILQLYHLLAFCARGEILQDSLPEILQQHVHEGILFSPRRLNDYSFQGLMPEGDHDHGHEILFGTYDPEKKVRYDIYLDAVCGLGLFYKKEPNAVISFCPTNSSTLMIYQIQGVRKSCFNQLEQLQKVQKSRGLMPLHWIEVLVAGVKEVAERFGYNTLSILGANNNHWTKSYNENMKPHLSLEKAIALYDNTAERLGFEQRDDGNWQIPINELFL